MEPVSAVISVAVSVFEREIEKLKDKIKSLEQKRECPFYNTFGNRIKCVYMDGWKCCEDIDICTGNSDAWCIERIEHSFAKKDT